MPSTYDLLMVVVDELYNIENDPEELNNIAREKQNIVDMLKEELLKSQAVAEKKSLGT